MKYLSKDEEAALRAIAERHNLIAQSGLHAGHGSTSQLLTALVNGDVQTIMLSDDERALIVNWIADQDPSDYLLRCALQNFVSQLMIVPRTS